MIVDLSASIRIAERAGQAAYVRAVHDSAQAVYAVLRDRGDVELAEELYQAVLDLSKKAPPRR